jgi:transposase-like protein
MENQDKSEFDQEIVKEYLEKSPSIFCPYCRSQETENFSAGGSVWEHFGDYRCKRCNGEWIEHWENTLTREEMRNIYRKAAESKEAWIEFLPVFAKSWRLVGIYPGDSESEEE